LLLGIEGITGLTPGAHHQKREAKSIHGQSLYCQQSSSKCRATVV
jgi:hypothetical protein